MGENYHLRMKIILPRQQHSLISTSLSMLKGLLPLQRGLKSLKVPLFMTFDSTATPEIIEIRFIHDI